MAESATTTVYEETGSEGEWAVDSVGHLKAPETDDDRNPRGLASQANARCLDGWLKVY